MQPALRDDHHGARQPERGLFWHCVAFVILSRHKPCESTPVTEKREAPMLQKVKPAVQLKDAQVLLTVVGGRIVHAAPSFR